MYQMYVLQFFWNEDWKDMKDYTSEPTRIGLIKIKNMERFFVETNPRNRYRIVLRTVRDGETIKEEIVEYT